MEQVNLSENYLSNSDCDFLIGYFEKHYEGNNHNGTSLLPMHVSNPYHLRKNLIRNYYIRNIEKNFPLKLNYDHLVYWPPGSFLDMHRDGHWDEHSNEWTSVCYLNDNFQGGETLIHKNFYTPKKGNLLLFNSKNVDHGVSQTYGPRYTYIAWWQEK